RPPPGVACGGRIAIVISAFPPSTGSVSAAVAFAVDPRSASRNSKARGDPPSWSRDSMAATAAAPDSMAGLPAGAADPVLQRHLNLDNAVTAPQQIDGQARLHAPAVGQRARRLECGSRQTALPRQRLSGCPTGRTQNPASG